MATQRDKYEEYVDGLQDSIQHKTYMLNNDLCYIEWLEEKLDKLEEANKSVKKAAK